MRTLILASAIILLAHSTSYAAALSIKFSNKSGAALNSVTATAKGSSPASTTNILTAPIANGASGTATFDAPTGTCVFTLVFTSGSGQINTRPDMDLCQSAGIIVD